MKNVKFIFSFLALVCFMFISTSALIAGDLIPKEDAIDVASSEVDNLTEIIQTNPGLDQDQVFDLRLKRAYLLEIAKILKQTPTSVEVSLTQASDIIIDMLSNRDPSMFTESIQEEVNRMFEK